MAGKVIAITGGKVAKFDPRKARKRDAQADAVIDYAKKVKDWPMLVEAVDQKIEDQTEFVRWWRENVRGRGKKVNNADRRYFVDDAEDITGITQQTVSKWRKRLSGVAKYREFLYGVAWRAAMAEKTDTTRGTTGTGENEWFTPPEYIALVREVMGEIDLDPASTDAAQKIVKAKAYYTKAINGLVQEWWGCVFMNPPYAQPLIAEFASKMVVEVRSQRVSEAISLTHNYTDTAWFHELAGVADAICFTRGRVKFIDADGGTCAPTQGQGFAYFGERAKLFVEVFSKIGFVVVKNPWEINER